MSPKTWAKLVWRRSPKFKGEPVEELVMNITDTEASGAFEARQSVAGSALHVEDQAPAACGADEPLAVARIPEAERPAADGSLRHRGAIAGANGSLAGRHLGYNGFLLRRLELGVTTLVRHGAGTAQAQGKRDLKGTPIRAT